MNIIIGALAVFAGGFIIGIILASVSDTIINGEDEQKTWERIERWKN